MSSTPYPQLLHAFFHDWLVQQRGVSHHTVLSYRDSWRLFLRFVAAQKNKSVAKLSLNDLTEIEVLAFLQHVEQVRKSSIGTRNCRLGALHSFFTFVADREPLAAAQCAAILHIPTKQAPKPEVSDLEEEEITAILAQPDRSRIEGQRDHVLLAILYNTGARIQEALNLSPQAVRLDIYESDRFRCGSCGAVFRAPLPVDVPPVTFDPTAKSMAAILRYGAGVPHYRLEKLQQQLGIPISDATLFSLSEQVADASFMVYRRLVVIAAQGKLLHADDTIMRILALMKEDEEGDGTQQRKGIYTTAIISILEEHEICLFFTGRSYAGENLDEFLKSRSQEIPAPMLMANGAIRNVPKTLQTVLLNCNTHSRRKFVDVYESFRNEVTHVIQELAIIYHNDEKTRDMALTPKERLTYHQEHSRPVMERLHDWCLGLLREKKVEPNSALGKAINYLDKHWAALTQFLKIPGAPISNDVVERLLKRAVLHRKNSMFYLTEHGAAVGDILMTLIQTAAGAGVNPFEYLTELQLHHKEACSRPDQWLPWTYRDSLARLRHSQAAA